MREHDRVDWHFPSKPPFEIRFVLCSLVRPDVTLELIRLIVSEPPQDVDVAERFKLPHVAAEILTCEVPQIKKKISSDEALLDVLYSFVEQDPPLNPLLSSFFSNSFSVLITRMSEQVRMRPEPVPSTQCREINRAIITLPNNNPVVSPRTGTTTRSFASRCLNSSRKRISSNTSSITSGPRRYRTWCCSSLPASMNTTSGETSCP